MVGRTTGSRADRREGGQAGLPEETPSYSWGGYIGMEGFTGKGREGGRVDRQR